MVKVTWPSWLPCLYMVKNKTSKTFFSRIVNWLQWNLVYSVWDSSQPEFVQIMTLGDLDLFYTKVKFGRRGFCTVTVKIIFSFGNRCSLWDAFNYMSKWSYMSVKSQGLSLILAKICRVSKLYIIFLKNCWVILKRKLIWKLLNEVEQKYIQIVWIIWKRWTHDPIC